MLGSADAGQLQDVQRADSTRQQDHFALGLGALDRAAALEFNPDRALAVEQDAPHQRPGDDL
jgi:hypothetical protein